MWFFPGSFVVVVVVVCWLAAVYSASSFGTENSIESSCMQPAEEENEQKKYTSPSPTQTTTTTAVTLGKKYQQRKKWQQPAKQTSLLSTAISNCTRAHTKTIPVYTIRFFSSFAPWIFLCFFFNSVGGKSFIFIALLFAPLLCTISHSARLCSFFDVLFVVVISCARVYIYYNSRNIFIQFLFFAYFFLSRFRRLLFSMRLCCWWFFFNLFVPLL